ncbi:DUF2809 domain-containing protein [Chryseosolibacter indicus]|uniref:DUF2809 domain-containing protein n=1 Tax=Chryseosolibacter indicus TaxID=2782351 RepID=A0ABS5VY94_9BACT|nr:DUF2809 domain-containing protein [Chryseosolibacter indicus]MBT1705817.1 DUF2809 domain-containing protein [Chryseosolibacter indicus]
MVRFHKRYFGLTIVIFIFEVLIALFARDRFVRPYLGDVLVVILIYCFIKSFLDVPVFPLAMFVLVFAFTIEFLQYLNIVEKLGLAHSALARTVIGTSFVWNDLVAYTSGIAILLMVEKFIFGKNLYRVQ